MTVNVVNHPIKDVIDSNMAQVQKEHEDGNLKAVLFWYTTNDGKEYSFRKDLNPLEAMGVCHVIQAALTEEL